VVFSLAKRRAGPVFSGRAARSCDVWS
jgi:hypothetical protein